MLKKKLKFIQVSCTEGSKIDKRQADAVKKYKPDLIIFEQPIGKFGVESIFNKFEVDKKPVREFNKAIKKLDKSSKKYKYAKSDILVWRNIWQLWNEGHNVKLYNVDAPDEFRRNLFKNFKYPGCRGNWVFWLYLLIRDSYMAKNIRPILNKYKNNNLVILIFLQTIHWSHVQFLLKNPSKKEIFNYYFRKFPSITEDNIKDRIKKEDKLYLKYIKTIDIL